MSPEACVISLFNEILNDEDALVIQGAKVYGTYTGYGNSVKFVGPNLTDDRNWATRKILAMDALQDPGSLADQVSGFVLKRELKKSFAAFSAVSGGIVSTGHWGCGVFGGELVHIFIDCICKSSSTFQPFFSTYLISNVLVLYSP